MRAKKKSLVAILMFALLCTMLFSTSASAKTKTVKKQTFTTTLSTAKKKAAAVKRGTVTLKLQGNSGFIKFKAPKTKTYKIKFSNPKTLSAKDPGRDVNFGFISGHKASSWGSLTFIDNKFSTKGGKNTTLFLCTKYSWSTRSHNSITSSSYLPSRTGKIKLKKGQTLYMYIYFANPKVKMNLSIK